MFQYLYHILYKYLPAHLPDPVIIIHECIHEYMHASSVPTVLCTSYSVLFPSPPRSPGRREMLTERMNEPNFEGQGATGQHPHPTSLAALTLLQRERLLQGRSAQQEEWIKTDAWTLYVGCCLLTFICVLRTRRARWYCILIVHIRGRHMVTTFPSLPSVT